MYLAILNSKSETRGSPEVISLSISSHSTIFECTSMVFDSSSLIISFSVSMLKAGIRGGLSGCKMVFLVSLERLA